MLAGLAPRLLLRLPRLRRASLVRRAVLGARVGAALVAEELSRRLERGRLRAVPEPAARRARRARRVLRGQAPRRAQQRAALRHEAVAPAPAPAPVAAVRAVGRARHSDIVDAEAQPAQLERAAARVLGRRHCGRGADRARNVV